jgi:hypothetical protein
VTPLVVARRSNLCRAQRNSCSLEHSIPWCHNPYTAASAWRLARCGAAGLAAGTPVMGAEARPWPVVSSWSPEGYSDRNCWDQMFAVVRQESLRRMSVGSGMALSQGNRRCQDLLS